VLLLLVVVVVVVVVLLLLVVVLPAAGAIAVLRAGLGALGRQHTSGARAGVRAAASSTRRPLLGVIIVGPAPALARGRLRTPRQRDPRADNTQRITCCGCWRQRS
jgi:hypothetical protein